MAKVAIDICNTIVDINGFLERRGFHRNPGAYFFNGLPADYFKKNLDVFLKAKPIDGAVEALHRFVDKGNEIVYLTARPEEAHEVTLENLFEINGFPKGEVVHSMDKAEDFKRLGCTYAIDDAPHEIENYVLAGCSVVVFNKDYNKQYAGYRICSWDNFCPEREAIRPEMRSFFNLKEV